MKIFNYLLTALAILSLASCMGVNDDGNFDEFKVIGFNVVSDDATGAQYINDEIQYTTRLNYDDQQLILTIDNLRLSALESPVSFELEPIALTFNNETNSYEANAAIARSVNGKQTITNLSFSFTVYAYFNSDDALETYMQLFRYSYDYNGYNVEFYLNTYAYQNKLTVVDANTDQQYESRDKSITYVTFDPKKNKARLLLTGVKFAEQMPALNMEYPEIDVKFVSGGYILESKELIPKNIGSSTSTPVPSRVVRNLYGLGTIGTGLNLDYTVGEIEQPVNSEYSYK